MEWLSPEGMVAQTPCNSQKLWAKVVLVDGSLPNPGLCMLPSVVPGEQVTGRRAGMRDRERGTDSHLASLASVSNSDDDNRP